MTMDTKCLVVDANILLSAVFGVRVRALLNDYADTVRFYAPDMCFEEAQRHIPAISIPQKVDPLTAFEFLERTIRLVEPVSQRLYKEHETAAHRRIAARDINDWPVLATSLLLNCPVWTEDQDFFGCGIATWTTQNVEIYLQDA
jgi:predicted nucleic acid-binding protein